MSVLVKTFAETGFCQSVRLAETGRNLFLPGRFKSQFKPLMAVTWQPGFLTSLALSFFHVLLMEWHCSGHRGFSSAAPRTWNAFPVTFHNVSNTVHFKRALKTYYFNLVFPTM